MSDELYGQINITLLVSLERIKEITENTVEVLTEAKIELAEVGIDSVVFIINRSPISKSDWTEFLTSLNDYEFCKYELSKYKFN